MRFSIIALAVSFVSTVMAQQAYPTDPVASTIWKAGGNFTVKWKPNASGQKIALTVDLFKGDPAHQTLVKKLGTGAPGKTSLKITLPANLNSDWYSVRVGDSYSHYFMIKGTGPAPTGGPPTAASTTTIAATSTVLPRTSSTPNSVATPTSTQSTATPTRSTSSASYLSTAPMGMIASAVVAAVLTLF